MNKFQIFRLKKFKMLSFFKLDDIFVHTKQTPKNKADSSLKRFLGFEILKCPSPIQS